jgi:hypothetical protein
MGGKSQGGWGGSTVKGKGTPVLGPGPEYPLVGHRREFLASFPDPLFMQNIQEERTGQGVI